jgi:fumarate reductase flavoprotein subunit
VVGGAAAVAGIAGCSAKSSTAAATQAQASTAATAAADDWLGTAPSVTPSDCKQTIETDVLVVGSAMSGVLSAYSAIQNGGAKVTMIERNGAPHISGSGVGFFDSKFQQAAGQPTHDTQLIMNKVMNEANLRVDPSLVTLWAYHSGDILDEIEENVLQPAGVPGTPSMGVPLNPDDLDQYESQFHVDFDATGSDSLEKFVLAFHDWITAHGGTITFNTCARKLVQDDSGAVTGLIATDANGDYVYYKTAKGVVMCVGSYGGNKDMVEHFCYPSMAHFIETYTQYNAKASDTCPVTTTESMDDGTGHKMMCWAGAIMEEIDPSYQSWSVDAYSFAAPLAVNNQGKRFMNECFSSLSTTFPIFELPDGANYVWQILGSDDFNMPPLLPIPNMTRAVMDQIASTAEHYDADTIEELAGKINVDPDTLVATVNRYNDLCASGRDDDFGKGSWHLNPVNTPPYHAYKEDYYFYSTTGGVKVNNKLQVVDKNWQPIPNLYAAGTCVGWRVGSGYQNVVPGLCNVYAAVHGYYAGENCAKQS